MDASEGSFYKREDGIVLIDLEKAKGISKDVMGSCPYGAIWWNDELDMPQKCIFCAHLIDDETWTPHTTRCTHSCPTEAMATYLVEPEEMQKIIEAEDLQEYLPEHGTKPHTLYKNLHKYTKNFITAGVLVDGDCYEGATVTLHSAEGGIVCNLFGAGVADCHDSSTLATRSTNFFGEFKFDGLDDGDYKVEVDADGKKHETSVTIAGESQNLGFIEL